MDLFEFIDCMVGKPSEFSKIKMYERGKHFFMVNRFCSIKYPIQANYFNHLKINTSQVVTYWHENLSKMYTKTPKWMYVSTKKDKEKKKSEQPIKDSTIKFYCKKFECSERDVNDGIRLVGTPFIEELLSIEKMLEKDK